MKNLVVGLVMVLMMGVVVFQRIEIVALKQQIASTEAPSVEDRKEANANVSAGVIESQSESGVASNRTSVERAEDSVSRSEETGTRMMRNFSNMMDNPEFNKMIVASQKATLEVMYEGLVDYLVLDEKEEEYFMDLLVSRQMKMVEHSMNLMGGNVSAEERQAAQKEMKAHAETIREEVEFFLNDEEDIDEWKFYEKTMEERMALTGVEQELEKSGIPLGEGESRELIETMLSEKEFFQFSNSLHDNQSVDTSPERFSKENIESWSQDLEELDARIAQSAGDILSEEQLQVFEKNQESMRELKRSQMRMAAQMFAGKKEE